MADLPSADDLLAQNAQSKTSQVRTFLQKCSDCGCIVKKHRKMQTVTVDGRGFCCVVPAPENNYGHLLVNKIY